MESVAISGNRNAPGPFLKLIIFIFKTRMVIEPHHEFGKRDLIVRETLLPICDRIGQD